jgi:hypothetical protein
MPRGRWSVGGCAAGLSIVTSAGIGPDKGAAVGRQKGGKEQRGRDPSALQLLGVKVRLKAPLQKSFTIFSNAAILTCTGWIKESLLSRPVWTTLVIVRRR